MKKLVIVSLDLMLALPFLALSLAILFPNIVGTQSYLLALGRFQNRTLNLYVTSQQIVSAIDTNLVNYSMAQKTASVLSAHNGVVSEIANTSYDRNCANLLTLCRLITISGSSRLLVVYYANAD